MKKTAHSICHVIPGSIADEMGIEPGDQLLDINGEFIIDILDYMERTTLENLEITILKKDGQVWVLEIEKDPDEELGLSFEITLMDGEKQCANKCIFCFVDQLPSHVRSSLQVKDDDWRFSFLMGNYITLTNLSPRDIERIIEKRINPLYLSVHTTNPELRKKMMGNRRAGELLALLQRFSMAKISIHCQIVLCRDWNDKKELDNTLRDLWGFRDIVQSISIVPVGLTGHRKELETLIPYDKEAAEEVIGQVEKWQLCFKEQGDSSFAFLADEFYILAERPIPEYEHYEDFPQIENGVGLIAKFCCEFYEALNNLDNWHRADSEELSIITGESSGIFIKELAQVTAEKTGKTINVYTIRNDFFGGQVTVSGLVTGGDILSQLEGQPLGGRILIPITMLRRGEDVFLDGMPLKELQRALGVPVVPVPIDGRAFIEEIVARY